MALLGSSVDPRLFVQDYSGFTRAADIQGQSMANIGADIGGIAKQFGEYKKQQSEQEKRVKSAELVANAIAKSFPTLAPVAMEAQMIMGDKNNSLQDRVAAADAVEKALNIGINNAYKEREFGLQERQFGLQEQRAKAEQIQASLPERSDWKPFDKEIEIDGQKVKVTGSVDQFGQFKDISNNVYPSVSDAFSPAGQAEPPLPDGAYPDGTPTVGTPINGSGVLPLDKQNKVPEPPINFDFNQFPSVPGDPTIAPETIANIEAAGEAPVARPSAFRLPPGASVVTDEQKGEIVTQEEANRRTASGLSVTATPVGKGMVRITSQTGSPKPSPVIESPESKLQTQRLLKLDESLGLLREAGTTASLDIQPLKEITNLLDANVKTGFGQETLMQAKKILGQDVSSEEEFQARVGAEAMKNIALTKGAISDREMDYFKTVLSPNMGKTTEGNKKIIEFRIKYADRANKISGTISDLQEQGKSPFEIKKAVDKIISSEPLLDNTSPKKTEVNQATEDAKFLGGFQ
jgi:hypothetical protein